MEEVARYNGSISAEHRIGQLKFDAFPAFKAPLEVRLMRAIRQAFDPRGPMNPGKLLERCQCEFPKSQKQMIVAAASEGIPTGILSHHSKQTRSFLNELR